MAKQINLTYNGVDYTLEYNRSAVRAMESQGFVLEDMETKPMTIIPILVEGAFRMHHSNIKRSTIDEIFNSIGNKTDFYMALGEMYADCVKSLMDDEEKNLEWKANF